MPNIGYLLKRTYKKEVLDKFRKEAEKHGADFLAPSPDYIYPSRVLPEDKRTGVRLGCATEDHVMKMFAFEIETQNLIEISPLWDYELVKVDVTETPLKKLSPKDLLSKTSRE